MNVGSLKKKIPLEILPLIINFPYSSIFLYFTLSADNISLTCKMNYVSVSSASNSLNKRISKVIKWLLLVILLTR